MDGNRERCKVQGCMASAGATCNRCQPGATVPVVTVKTPVRKGTVLGWLGGTLLVAKGRGAKR